MNAKLIGVVLVAFLVVMFFIQKSRISSLELKLDESKKLAESHASTIETMKLNNAEVALIDKTKTKELKDAKAQIEQLERDVATGNKRLLVSARCTTVPTKPSTASVDDERTAQLTANAERAYFRLRNQHELVIKQLTGLQEYVRALPAECVAQPLVTAR
ncbi:lysis system i-spanin subunit Rz [Vibrio diazotrophicus]|uniref:lysis system i-spanin subunit Rz n=1 Tax=Vibrio diazotrophicus TaxID=685 RepID=UPI000C9E695C|nr:lysis system i-spanin subunit Rz [Vibrio diazotrophicus]PNH87397.1 lysis protein [Vibrio diazotrophicus]